MKLKITKNDNVAITMTREEYNVVLTLMAHVRLGVSSNSEVAYDFLEMHDSMYDQDFDTVDLRVTYDGLEDTHTIELP